MLGSQQKIILYAHNKGLTAGLWLGNRMQSYQLFDHTDEGHTAFSKYLSQHADINISVIADAIEEDYKLESMPHTRGPERRELIDRRLNQFNRTSQFRTAHFIKRSKDNRRDDNFLFVALNNPDFLQDWIDIILANQAPIVGIYLLPMLSQMIVRQMKLMAPHILFCQRMSSGLRQTYLHNGRLRMSRLVPMNDVKPHQHAYFYFGETDKTRLYLLSQRLITGDTPLQMVLPSTDESVAEIATSISRDHGIECKVVDVLAFAKNIGANPKHVKAHGELLHMQLLANGNLPDNFAPQELTQTYNINNIKRNINLASITLGVIGLLLAAYFTLHGYQQKQKIESLAQQTLAQEQLYQQVAKNFPTTPIASADLKIAVQLAQNIKLHQHTPERMMQTLSSALETMPQIALSRIHWQQSTNIDDVDTNDQNNTQPTASVSNTGDTTLWQMAFVSAEIKNFTGDYRAALDNVNQLVNNLRANPQVQQVAIIQEPVNVSSLANLQGSTTDEATAERTPATFTIKIVLKQIADAAS